MNASGVAHLLNGLEPRCCGGVLPHRADRDGLSWSVDLVLLDDEVCEPVRQLLHDVALRDGRETSLDAQFRSARTLVGLLGAAAQLR